MALSAQQVEDIMMFHLGNLSTSGQPVDRETIFGQALSRRAVAGMSARALFKLLARRDVIVNGGQDKPWPERWVEQSVAGLAPQLAD